MKFLTKLGQILLKATEIVSGIAPYASAVFPGHDKEIQIVSNDLAQVANVVVQVEAVGQVLQLPGASKLIAAAPGVAQVILQSSLLVGRKIADPALFKQGTTKVADGMADILNSLKDDVESENKA